MTEIDDDIRFNVETVFSLLAQDQAKAAVEETLGNFATNDISKVASLKWAEFEMSGKFIRAGSSDIKEQTTKIFAKPFEDVDIKRLIDFSELGGIEPGALVPVAGLDCFLWFVPVTSSSRTDITPMRLRGFCIWATLFHEVMQIFNPPASLTASEQRICFQTVAGLSLREAASVDNVSVETKRSQMKSLCRKMQCSGQADILRKVLGQMVHFLSISEAEAAHARLAEQFVTNHLSKHVSLTIKRLPNGRIMRMLECGPIGGRPVIMIHGMMFAQFIKGLSGKLEELNLRLIVPLRHGHLEAQTMSSLYEDDYVISKSIEDLALFLIEFGPSPAVVLGNSMGAPIAANFANKHPKLVSQLILLSANLAEGIPADSHMLDRFYTGLNHLVTRPGLFRLVAWQFRKYYVDEKTVRKVFGKLFGRSTDDIDVLEGKYTGASAYPMFIEHYKTSIKGIAEDFSFVMQNWKREFCRLRVNTTYIHGADDPVVALDEFQDSALQNPNAKILSIEGAGHFMALSHANQVWTEIHKIVEDNDEHGE